MLKSFLWIAVSALVFIAAWNVVRGNHMWDFKSYYGASRSVVKGDNPYLIRNIQSPEISTDLPFVYSPAALPFFLPYALVPFDMAVKLWGVTLLVCTLLLLWMWIKNFVGRSHRLWFALLCALGFNGTLYAALKTGNAAIPINLLIWLGFLLFIRGNFAGFALAIVGASVFKLTPVVFLGLLFLPSVLARAQKVRMAGIGSVGLLIVALLSFAVTPWKWLLSYGMALKGLSEGSAADRGSINPSAGALIRDVLMRFDLEGSVTDAVGLLVYGMILVVAATILWRTLQRIVRSSMGGREKRLWSVVVSCLAYAVIMPRFKNYSYVFLLVPAYIVLAHAGFLSSRKLLLVLIALSTAPHSWVPGVQTGLAFLWDYYPWFLACGLGLLAVAEINRIEAPRGRKPGESKGLVQW